MRRIAVLMLNAEDDQEGQARVAAFRQGLQALGWTEGKNLRIDWYWTAGDVERIGHQVARGTGRDADAGAELGGGGRWVTLMRRRRQNTTVEAPGTAPPAEVGGSQVGGR